MHLIGKIGVAIVKNTGIQFGGNFYSCSRAIRERWFELAWKYGNSKISIHYDTTDISRIYLHDKMTDEWDVCWIIIRQSLSGEKLQRYFDSIQKLKKIRKRMYEDSNN